MIATKKKVLIGFSGGVDSTIAAYLLQKQGYEVTGCFMRNWDAIANNDINGNPTLNGAKCAQELDYDEAVKAATVLDIPLIRHDFIDIYWDSVFTAFIDGLKKGLTPNPDVFCNRFVKFGSFAAFAKAQGFDYIAMGHYARRAMIDDKPYLALPKDLAKDQTYFLCLTAKDQLAYCLFPLAAMTKSEVRALAQQLQLPNAYKRGSTGVCFIGERNFRPFLTNYLALKKGPIIDLATRRLVGEHEGAYFYTIGQRKGLAIGGIKGIAPLPFHVVSKDINTNTLYVAQEKGTTYRFSTGCILSHFNWLGYQTPLAQQACLCKFRYRSKSLPVNLQLAADGKTATLHYDNYAYITPGQIACLYDQAGICLGGGVIEKLQGQNLVASA